MLHDVFVRGLTYDGNLFHTLLNHGLVAVTTVPFFIPARAARGPARWAWCWCFLLALSLQVWLWLQVGGVGVSVVWCTMAGYALLARLRERTQAEPLRRNLLTLALGCALAAILFYALTFPPITTVAHLLALAVGAGVYLLLDWLLDAIQQPRSARSNQ